jgi:hypothetical protein
MTVVVPPPVPLEPPPEREADVRAVVEAVAAAAHRLALVDGVLTGPSGRVPRWQGADAVAAAGQTAAVAELAGGVVEALMVAAGRLSAHADLLGEGARAVALLRAEQDDDFAATWGRLGRLHPDPGFAMRADAPEAVAVVEDLRIAEEARRRRHAAVLEEVDDDARRAAEVLVRSSAVVGGLGRAGDDARAVVHLAPRLPAWGEVELAARGRELAEGLLLGDLTAREDRAGEAVLYTSSPVFASALLAGLGPLGVADLLGLLGDGEAGLPADGAVAAVLAGAFGAAVRTTQADDPVGAVLDARYVDPEQDGSTADAVVLGMGAVLAAGLGGRARGPAPSVALAWGRQMLARELAQAQSGWGARALDRATGDSGDGAATDPLVLVARTLTRADEPASAAAFLGEHQVWEQLLARPWDDGARSLSELIARAAEDPGPAGQAAVRNGLETLGTGLEDQDPDGWRVDRDTARAVAPALGGGLAAHVAVAVDTLWIGVDGPAHAGRSAAARGLGLVTLDPAARSLLQESLLGWARTDLAAEGPVPDGSAVVPAIAVAGAFLAVQEYGQDLDDALDGFEARDAAQLRERRWSAIGWLGELPGPVGGVLGAVESLLALPLRMDGTWEYTPDPRASLEAGDASTAVPEALGPAVTGRTDEVARQAADAFVRAAGVLGCPAPPMSPEQDWTDPLMGLMGPGLGEVLERLLRSVRRGGGG